MPKVLKPPTGNQVKCGECGALLQYMPQEVEKYSGKARYCSYRVNRASRTRRSDHELRRVSS